MSSRLKRLVLLLAIAVMPLQGIAGALSVLACHGEAQAHASHAQDGHDRDHDHGASHHEQHDDTGAGGDPVYHLCCNHTASGIPAAVLPETTSVFPPPATVPATLHDLFFPDRPQRPPLA